LAACSAGILGKHHEIHPQLGIPIVLLGRLCDRAGRNHDFCNLGSLCLARICQLAGECEKTFALQFFGFVVGLAMIAVAPLF
jgi:hypothetical protein